MDEYRRAVGEQPAQADAEDVEALSTLRQLVPPHPEEQALLERLELALGRLTEPVAAHLELEEAGSGKAGKSFRFLSTLPFPLLPGGPTDVAVPGLAWMARSPGGGRTALVALHPGFAAELTPMQVLTRFVRDAGVDVYAPWAPHHGPRNQTQWPSGAELVCRGAAGMILSVLQQEAEVVALVLGLRARGYQRVFVAGASLGGLAGALAVSKVSVEGAGLLVPATDLQTELWPALCKCESAPDVSALVQRGFAAIRAVDRRPVPSTPCSAIHVIAAAGDGVCRLSSIRQFCRAWGLEPPTVVDGGHLGFFQRWDEVRRWLTQKLFPTD